VKDVFEYFNNIYYIWELLSAFIVNKKRNPFEE